MPSGEEQFDLSTIGRDEIEQRLARAALAADDLRDPALQKLLRCTEAALADWRSQLDQVTHYERSLSVARALSAVGKRRLVGLLEVVDELTMALPEPLRSGPVRRGGIVSLPEPGEDAAASAAGWRAYLLGPFRLVVQGREVDCWRGRRTQALAQFLAYHHQAAVDRELLVEALWPELEDGSGRHRLHQAVYALRQTLRLLDNGTQHIVCRDGAYQLNPELGLWTDVDEFEARLSEARAAERQGDEPGALAAYRAAEVLYRDDFLANVSVIDWAAEARETLRTRYVLAGLRVAEHLLAAGDLEATVSLCNRVAARDPWNEEITRIQVQALAAGGHASTALRAYRAFEERLRIDLGVEPSAVLRSAFQDIVDQRQAGVSA